MRYTGKVPNTFKAMFDVGTGEIGCEACVDTCAYAKALLSNDTKTKAELEIKYGSRD